MKKKLTALTLSLVLALSLVACGGEEKKTETAKTNATTETSAAPTEKTKEVAPVAEESKPEVVEETPEEIVEEEIPTDVRGIDSYLTKNGEVGDYIISEDDVLVLKINEHGSTIKCHIKIINDKMYKDSEHQTLQDATRMITYDYYLDPNHKIDYHDRFLAIKDRLDEGIHINVRAEYTDDPTLIKMSYVFPDGTMDWIKNDVVPMDYKENILNYEKGTREYTFGNWIYFGPNSDPRNATELAGVLIPIDEIQNDTVTFIASKDDFINNKLSNEEWLTSDILTVITILSNVSIVFDVPTDKIDAYSNYTLVTD
ncbi:MAG: hypothetical protein IJR00_05145 [Lachnospiraceae bacterium]|nr:hypothetical protein [Lachnospiraceae bacterium]